MSDDETRPIEPGAPTPPPTAPTVGAPAPQESAAPPTQAQPAYAMPVPAGYPAYAAPPERPRFADQVMGMRAVVATALACLIVGGLSGFVLGHAAGSDDGGFGRGPGGFGSFQQRGTFPGGANGAPNQQFGQGQSGR
jgi:hypothetical protein